MNLVCHIPDPDDATSFYRALQPVAQLRRIMPIQTCVLGKEIAAKDLAHADVCFIQRPFTKEHLALMEMCQQLGVKVWIDYDDNLLCLHESNPANFVYGKADTKWNVAKFLSLADAVTVSTEQLKRDLSPYRPDGTIEVIPNALNDYVLKHTPVFKEHRLATWRGSQSHQADLLRCADSIVRASERHKSWTFNFMGFNPWFLVEKIGDRALHTDPLPVLAYHHVMKETYPNVVYVTISDTPFNRCKSNIAWIEATYAGAIAVAPEMDEWKRPGVLNYRDPAHLERVLGDALSLSASEKAQIHAISWNFIKENLLLSKVNHQRKALLESLA